MLMWGVFQINTSRNFTRLRILTTGIILYSWTKLTPRNTLVTNYCVIITVYHLQQGDILQEFFQSINSSPFAMEAQLFLKYFISILYYLLWDSFLWASGNFPCITFSLWFFASGWPSSNPFASGHACFAVGWLRFLPHRASFSTQSLNVS